MPVGHAKKAFVLILHPNPVLQRTHIISKVQFTGRAHTTEHALAVFRRSLHCSGSPVTTDTSGLAVASASNRMGKSHAGLDRYYHANPAARSPRSQVQNHGETGCPALRGFRRVATSKAGANDAYNSA